MVMIHSFQSLSHVQLYTTHAVQHTRLPYPSPTPRAYSNSSPSSQSFMPSNHLVFCHPLQFWPSVFPSIRVYSKESVLHIRWPSIGVSASVLSVNIQDWIPLGLTGWISVQSKWLSRVFSKPQFKRISSLVLSFLYTPNVTSIHDHWKNHSFD